MTGKQDTKNLCSLPLKPANKNVLLSLTYQFVKDGLEEVGKLTVVGKIFFIIFNKVSERIIKQHCTCYFSE